MRAEAGLGWEVEGADRAGALPSHWSRQWAPGSLAAMIKRLRADAGFSVPRLGIGGASPGFSPEAAGVPNTS